MARPPRPHKTDTERHCSQRHLAPVICRPVRKGGKLAQMRYERPSNLIGTTIPKFALEGA